MNSVKFRAGTQSRLRCKYCFTNMACPSKISFFLSVCTVVDYIEMGIEFRQLTYNVSYILKSCRNQVNVLVAA